MPAIVTGFNLIAGDADCVLSRTGILVPCDLAPCDLLPCDLLPCVLIGALGFSALGFSVLGFSGSCSDL